MKLEKMLQSQGFGSRRECRALVLGGRVSLAGIVADDPEAEVLTEGCTFTVDGEAWSFCERVYLMLHKPVGFECSHQPQCHPSVFSLLPAPLRLRGVQAVGRLDEDTSGLLLFSDDGQFVHAYSSGKRQVPKVYVVTTRHPITAALASSLLGGVVLRDDPAPVVARVCEVLGERQLRLTVTEGRYHLVRRMIAAAGNRVEALQRSAVGAYSLPEDLPPGQWRMVAPLPPTSLA
ncbi:pseudouridine synthase [Rhodocyclus tenuis]|uniref:pseudouridine synthase n=1 Tax=Rhodocyclus gracilis TaxID=2929842 RepID=UPI001352FAC3|nr:pseudouridine synthase [Rhodocyclus gracilis]